MKSYCLAITLLACNSAHAQQELYVCTLLGEVFEVLDYATAPSLRLVPITGTLPQVAGDIALGPLNGYLYVCEFNVLGLGTFIYAFDRVSGALLATDVCYFTSMHTSHALDALRDGRLIGEDEYTGQLVRTTAAIPLCFPDTGPATGAVNPGDHAVLHDGRLLATRSGTTMLEFVDPSSGATTPAFDPGIGFSGLDVDRNDDIYGLTPSGDLFRIDPQTLVVTQLGHLPPPPSEWWTGLGFLHGPDPYIASQACASLPNSTGAGASLAVTSVTGPPPGTLHFVVDDMPPGNLTLLLASLTTTLTPLGSGNLCIGPVGLQRIDPPALADSSGRADIALDLAAVPGHGAVVPGDRLYFQAWFRDLLPGQPATMNLSESLRIDFL